MIEEFTDDQKEVLMMRYLRDMRFKEDVERVHER